MKDTRIPFDLTKSEDLSVEIRTDKWSDQNTGRPRKRPLVNPVPGSCSHSGATGVKGHMRGVGSEPRQDAVRVTVRKRVDLHVVVGACRHQLTVLWMEVSSVPGTDLLNCHQTSISPTFRAREYTFSPTVMNFGSSSSRPSHIRTSPSLPQVTKNLQIEDVPKKYHILLI